MINSFQESFSSSCCHNFRVPHYHDSSDLSHCTDHTADYYRALHQIAMCLCDHKTVPLHVLVVRKCLLRIDMDCNHLDLGHLNAHDSDYHIGSRLMLLDLEK